MTVEFGRVDTLRLDIAYIEAGPSNGPPVVLLHGFPYDVEAYAEVSPILAEAGCRVIVPWLRGYGPTRFRASETRSGEQAALAQDLLDLIDALALDRPVVAGYDWGGRAACLVSALWPERVAGLVTGGGYNVLPHLDPTKLLSPSSEHMLWYNRVLHHPDAPDWMAANRDTFCRYLWHSWSPDWQFDDAMFERTRPSFENPDFDTVVIHSYRHRWGLADGDPSLADLAKLCAAHPAIGVPTVALKGSSGALATGAPLDRGKFTHDHLEYRCLPGIGHNIPQEAPALFAASVLSLVRRSS